MAGLIDADGSISVKYEKNKKNFVPAITIYNCNILYLKFIQKIFGGKLRWKKTGKCKKMKNWRKCGELIISNNGCIWLLQNIYQYLKVKKVQCKYILRLWKIKQKYNLKYLGKYNSLKTRVKLILEKIKLIVNKLNERGALNTFYIQPSMVSNLNIYPYLAGFSDADGSFMIKKINNKNIIHYNITNTNITPVKIVSELTDTNICIRNHTNKNWKNSYYITLSSNKAYNFINNIEKYLILKKKQAKICIKLQELKNTMNIAQKRWNKNKYLKILNKEEKWRQQCCILNKRGI